MAQATFDWQRKQKEADYQHLLKFFKSRPQLLVDCGLYIEDIDGFRYFFRNSAGAIEERKAKWEDRGKLSTKAYMTANRG